MSVRSAGTRAEDPGAIPASGGEMQVGLILDVDREAEQVLEKLARKNPTYADVRHRLGLLKLSRGDHAAARGEFEEALGIHPGYRAAYYALRLAQTLAGTLPPEGSLTPAGPDAPREETAWATIDEAYRRAAMGKDPLDALRAWELERPQLFHLYAAALSGRRSDLGATRQHLETAAQADPTTRTILETAGVLPWDEAQTARALQPILGLLWSPLAADLYSYLGRIYARNGLRTEALAQYDRAYLVFPDEAARARHRAELAIAAGDEEAAVELLTQAIEADPTCVEVRIALGFEHAAQGYAEEARVQFEVAAKLAPDYADVRYNLGLLYEGANRIEEALDQFRRALHLNPSYLPARHTMASLLCRIGRHAEGLCEYERILRQGFQSADMLVKMGRAALLLDRVDEALQYLERAAFINPDYPAGYYFLGQAYKSKGLKNKARAAWRRYLDRSAEGGVLSWGELPRPAEPPD